MDVALIYNFTRKKNPAWKKQAEAFKRAGELAGFRLFLLDNLKGLEVVSQYRRSFGFVYLYDYDPYLAGAFACMGIPVFNDYQNMETCHDKALTYLKMAAFDVPMPRFYAAMSTNGLPYDSLYEFITTELVRKKITYPFILRDRYGEGNDVGTLVASPIEFAQFLKQRGDKAFIVEDYSPGPYYVAYVVGKTCYGLLERRKGSPKFGKNDVLIPNEQADTRFIRSLAVKAIDAAGLDAGMVYFRMKGKLPLVVGLSGSIRTVAFQTVTSIDLAELTFNYFKKIYRKKFPFVWPEEKARFLKMATAGRKLKEIDEP